MVCSLSINHFRVAHVVNFDMPSLVVQCLSCVKKASFVTAFFNGENMDFSGDLLNILHRTSQDIPQRLGSMSSSSIDQDQLKLMEGEKYPLVPYQRTKMHALDPHRKVTLHMLVPRRNAKMHLLFRCQNAVILHRRDHTNEYGLP